MPFEGLTYSNFMLNHQHQKTVTHLKETINFQKTKIDLLERRLKRKDAVYNKYVHLDKKISKISIACLVGFGASVLGLSLAAVPLTPLFGSFAVITACTTSASIFISLFFASHLR